MTDKRKRGRPLMAESERRRNTVNVRLDDAAHSKVEQAASEAGRSLSGEIQHRLADYESMRDFVAQLLADGAAIDVIFGMQAVRKIAGSKGIGIRLDNSQLSFERAITMASCMSKLFAVVTDHASNTLARSIAVQLAAAWREKKETGEIAHDFDIEVTAADISTKIAQHAQIKGVDVATDVALILGPHIWDICFDKDDSLRSAHIGPGRELMGTLRSSDVGLPPVFVPSPPTKEDRLAFMKKLKKSGAIRDAAKHQISEGKHPEKSEQEVVDMLYDDLLKPFGMDPGEAVPDVATG